MHEVRTVDVCYSTLECIFEIVSFPSRYFLYSPVTAGCKVGAFLPFYFNLLWDSSRHFLVIITRFNDPGFSIQILNLPPRTTYFNTAFWRIRLETMSEIKQIKRHTKELIKKFLTINQSRTMTLRYFFRIRLEHDIFKFLFSNSMRLLDPNILGLSRLWNDFSWHLEIVRHMLIQLKYLLNIGPG